MPTLLEQYKAENEQDAQIPNGALAYILWEKDYKGNAEDPVSLEQYADAVGLNPDETAEMLKFSQKADSLATSEQPQAEEEEQSFFQERAMKVAEGATFGWGDELFASIAALDDVVTEGKDFSTAYRKYQSEYQAKMDEYAKKRPLEALTFELAGGFAVPLGLLKTPKVIADLVSKGGTARKLAVSGASGAVAGASYGAGSAKPDELYEGAIQGGAFGFGLGAVGQVVVSKISNAKLRNQMRRANVNPTVQALEQAKDAAYKAVDNSGVKFSHQEVKDLYHDTLTDLASNKSVYDPDFYKHTALAVKHLKNRAEGGFLKLSDLETTKKHLSKLYNDSKGKDHYIIDMINRIDDKIENKFVNNTDNVVQVARIANSRYMKFKQVEDMFEKAKITAEAKGQPTNIQYRKIIGDLLKDEKRMRFYTDQEKNVMRSFVQGSFSQNLMNNIGKFAPTTNGLMSFLHLGAFAANPALAAVSGASLAARGLSTRAGKRGVEDIQRVIAAPGMTREEVALAQQELVNRIQGAQQYQGAGAASALVHNIIGENI